jgi:hypothetical protein
VVADGGHHVGRYRIMYIVEGDLITIQRIDRVSGD